MSARRWMHAACACVIAWAGAAGAHQSSDAYLRASADAQGRLALQIDVALRDLDVVLDLDADGDGRLIWGEVRPREAEIDDYVAAHLRIDDGRCRLRAQPGLVLDRKADGVYAVLRYSGDCAAAASPSLAYALFRESDPTHRGLLAVLDAAGRPTGALLSLPPGGAPVALGFGTAAVPPGAAQAAPADEPAAGFFASGLHHILIGADHVLFLVCLLLPLVLMTTPRSAPSATRPPRGSRIAGDPRSLDAVRGTTARQAAWPLLALVTAFTLGHSITLGLASLRIVSLSPAVIEPLIAVTIALTAIDNLRPFFRGHRAVAAFFFGLVHGFGFAGPLIELDLAPAAMAWALLQFNLGVEAGQLVVVVMATLLLWPLRTRPAAKRVLQGGSIAAGLVAIVWFAERVAGFKLLPF